MLIVDWIPITEMAILPLFGEELYAHISSYKGITKRMSCSSWNLLYRVLTENSLPVDHYVSFTETGKPYFIDSQVYFSISHSKEVCAVAVSDRPVGVDVERYRDLYEPHLIERSLTVAERLSFDGDFTRIWCRKEAVAKMIGIGITDYPSNIETTAYQFQEQQIEFAGKLYWLVAVDSAKIVSNDL